MKTKVPYTIIHNLKEWDYVKNKLESFGYNYKNVYNITFNCIIVINYIGIIGNVTNYSIANNYMSNYHNRYFIEDIEEFLQEAAKLKNYKYNSNMKTNKTYKELIQLGTVVEQNNGEKGLVIKTIVDGEEDIIILFEHGFSRLSEFDDNLIIIGRNIDYCYNINKIYKTLHYTNGFVVINDLTEKDIIWKRDNTVILTMEEIANKFGIDVNNLKIKL